MPQEISLRLVLQELLQRQPGTDRLLLVIDQWEELFTLTDDESREVFVSALIDALDQSPLSIVATIRGDFLEDMLDNRRLSDRLTVEHIGGLNEDEQREMIERPAEVIGVGLEPGLAERILVDLRKSSEGLPLLEFVLTQLWDRRAGGPLRHRDYDAIGHVGGAIAAHADDVLEKKLTASERDIARKVLLRLIRPGRKGTEPTKQPCDFGELPEGSADVVKSLADGRLIITSVKAGTDEKTVELAHEALIKQWGRLAAWIAEETRFLVWRDGLHVDIERWEDSNHSRGLLLRGRALRDAKAWRKSHDDQLSADEREFVGRSDRFFKTWFAAVVAFFALAAILIPVIGWKQERDVGAPGADGADGKIVAIETESGSSAVPRYGVLTGRVLQRRKGRGTDPHYQIEVMGSGTRHRVSVNLRPASGKEMLYTIKEPFSHPLLSNLPLEKRAPGFTFLLGAGVGLDYVGGGFVSRDEMRALPVERLNDVLDELVARAQNDPQARIHVFGTAWNDGNSRDKIFGFTPSQGVHHVHMNQGFPAPNEGANAIGQDGALFFQFGDRHWAAVFFAYPEQSWAPGEPVAAVVDAAGRKAAGAKLIRVVRST